MAQVNEILSQTDYYGCWVGKFVTYYNCAYSFFPDEVGPVAQSV